MFGRLVNSPSTRGLYYLFYSYAGISGGAQLTTLVAGEAAEEVEKQRDETVAAEVMKILRQIFPGAGAVPEPVKVFLSNLVL